tara:strand:+ start:6515 stop:7342 length:828 start_codon:yes stop_codon:yes gene_type:complete
MAKSKAVAKQESGALPTFMNDYRGEGTEAGTSEDLIIPRVILLQGISELVQSGDEKAGDFYHLLGDLSLGDTVRIIPLYYTKRYLLWNPRHDGGGILARSDDGVHWNPANREFEVNLYKGQKKTGVWKTADTVRESGLADWGSYDPDEEDSPPAATAMHCFACWLPDHPELSPCVITCQRSSEKIGKELYSKLKMANAPSYGLVYEMSSSDETNDRNEDFKSYKFKRVGFVEDEAEFLSMREYYESFKNLGMQIRDEEGMQESESSVPTEEDERM